MHIAICDDEITETILIEKLLSQYQRTHLRPKMEVSIFSCASELLAAVNANQCFSLYLLDIIMPDMSGIQLAERLSQISRKTPIVFLTGSADFALDAFHVHARDYLVKPISKPDFYEMLDRITSEIAHLESTVLTIPTKQHLTVTVPLSSIVYAECIRHQINYHLTDDSIINSRSIRVPFSDAIRPLLDSGRFLLTHRSYAVNADQILHLTSESIVLFNGQKIPLSRLRQAEVRNLYMDFLSNRSLP